MKNCTWTIFSTPDFYRGATAVAPAHQVKPIKLIATIF
ncbi:hypothetical protein ED5_1219 [Enterobacter roggenkampii]|nr:hypothetical protein ED5_1219 [Enterobacter roggenkampii]